MNCQADLLQELDSSAQRYQFPLWDRDKDYAFTGAMRVSGFTSTSGIALVFENIEYSFREQVIQNIAYGFATFVVTSWRCLGNGVYVPRSDMIDSDTGEFHPSFGEFEAASRRRSFVISLEKDECIAGNYLGTEVDVITPQALLFKLCDTIPQDWLFSTPEHIRSAFGMDSETQLLFCLSKWQHPSSEVYEESVKPSSYPDIMVMAAALCSKDPSPQLVSTFNTSWRAQWLA